MSPRIDATLLHDTRGPNTKNSNFCIMEEYFFVLSKLNVCVKSFPFHVLMILRDMERGLLYNLVVESLLPCLHDIHLAEYIITYMLN